MPKGNFCMSCILLINKAVMTSRCCKPYATLTAFNGLVRFSWSTHCLFSSTTFYQMKRNGVWSTLRRSYCMKQNDIVLNQIPAKWKDVSQWPYKAPGMKSIEASLQLMPYSPTSTKQKKSLSLEGSIYYPFCVLTSNTDNQKPNISSILFQTTLTGFQKGLLDL